MRTDPAWREESFHPPHASRSYSVKTWRRGDTIVTVDHYSHHTEEEARQRARRLAEGSSIGFRPIDGYGDDAYLIWAEA